MSEADRPPQRVPVLIVGAGPAGLAASLLLQQYGVPALTITRYGWTAHKPRAHHVNPSAMELLRGLGVEDAVRGAAMPQDLVRNIVWCINLAGDELGRLGTYHHGGPYGYVGLTPSEAVNIPQHKFGPVLAETFLARGGRLTFQHPVRRGPRNRKPCPGQAPGSRHRLDVLGRGRLSDRRRRCQQRDR